MNAVCGIKDAWAVKNLVPEMKDPPPKYDVPIRAGVCKDTEGGRGGVVIDTPYNTQKVISPQPDGVGRRLDAYA